MNRLLLILIFVLWIPETFAQSPRHGSKNLIHLLDTTTISLKGKNATTLLINHTADTIKLVATIDHILLPGEQSVNVVITPGGQQAFDLQLYYPDFIRLDRFPFSVYNAPGKTVECIIENSMPSLVTFKGDLKDENVYYQAFHKAERNNQVYYRLGATLQNFGNFPHLADSINHINLNFLSTYQGSLPQGFNQRERQRLHYNNAFLKYHVPFDKSFKIGKAIAVNQAFYDFEKVIPLAADTVMLSTAYLWYATFNLRRQALLKNADEAQLKQNMLREADIAYPGYELGDALKMHLLYKIYASSAKEYQSAVKATRFVNPINSIITESVAAARFQLPKLNKPAPVFSLINMQGDTVLLKSFAGRPVIINFWAPWCLPCIKEFAAENRLFEKYNQPDGLVVVNICVDATLPDWKRLSAIHHLNMVNLYADAAAYAKLKKRYDLSSLPKSIALSKNQTVTHNHLKRASELSDQEIRELMSL
jgi:thiol-disulfide isomerase/thioredoxin